MKKTFYALGIFVLLLTGCNSSNRKCIENEFKGKLQAHKELVEIGTKKFRINTEPRTDLCTYSFGMMTSVIKYLRF